MPAIPAAPSAYIGSGWLDGLASLVGPGQGQMNGLPTVFAIARALANGIFVSHWIRQGR